MQLPEPLDPYLYRGRFSRAVDGDTAVLHVDLGFSTWRLASRFPGGPDARYPQGRYRLNGISTPEMREPGGREAFGRVKELVSLAEKPGEVLVRTTKHGRARFLVDLFVRVVTQSDPFTDGTIDVDDEREHWLAEEDLLSFVRQTPANTLSTVRAMATEILWRRRQLRGGDGSVIHVNQQLLDEGLAKPYGS